jgi:NADH:ubiquinone oxidoreductase subunit
MSIIDSLSIRFFFKKVGTDQFGNKYFVGNKKNYLGQNKRYVIYKGICDGSKIPAIWHAWLHYSSQDFPSDSSGIDYDWQISHVQNLTGTKEAYNPSKSNNIKLASYSKWTPENFKKEKL